MVKEILLSVFLNGMAENYLNFATLYDWAPNNPLLNSVYVAWSRMF